MTIEFGESFACSGEVETGVIELGWDATVSVRVGTGKTYSAAMGAVEGAVMERGLARRGNGKEGDDERHGG